jgi:hypothetical protein
MDLALDDVIARNKTVQEEQAMDQSEVQVKSAVHAESKELPLSNHIQRRLDFCRRRETERQHRRRDRRPPASTRTNEPWQHDCFDAEKEEPPREMPVERRRIDHPQRSAAASVRIAQLHYDILEDDLKHMLEEDDIRHVQRISVRFDSAGRSLGIAQISFGRVDEARELVRRWRDKSVNGQVLQIELQQDQRLPQRAPIQDRLADRRDSWRSQSHVDRPDPYRSRPSEQRDRRW